MLRHLGGIGVFILAALDSSVLPTLGGVDALTVVLASLHPERWPYYALCSMAGSVCGASAAYRLSRLGILHRRIKGAAFDRVTAFLHRFGSLSLSLAAFLPPPFPTSAFVVGAGRDALSFRFVCAVFWYGTSVPLCSTRLPRICFRQTVRDKYVVGAHAGTCSGDFRCAAVCRTASVARVQEIGTAYALRFVALFATGLRRTLPLPTAGLLAYRFRPRYPQDLQRVCPEPLWWSRNLRSIEWLYNVDQFCGNISSTIVFWGLPRFQTFAVRPIIRAQWLARSRLGRTGGRCSSWLPITALAIPAMALKH
jgi:membrane protein YqaA with SNARE-associated domain